MIDARFAGSGSRDRSRRVIKDELKNGLAKLRLINDNCKVES